MHCAEVFMMSFNQIFLVCLQKVVNLHHKTEDYRKYVFDFHVVKLHSTKKNSLIYFEYLWPYVT
jgi:hypothetical protein